MWWLCQTTFHRAHTIEHRSFISLGGAFDARWWGTGTPCPTISGVGCQKVDTCLHCARPPIFGPLIPSPIVACRHLDRMPTHRSLPHSLHLCPAAKRLAPIILSYLFFCPPFIHSESSSFKQLLALLHNGVSRGQLESDGILLLALARCKAFPASPR